MNVLGARAIATTLALTAATLAAGCLADPEEAACPGRLYVTMHWDQSFERGALREALEARGYEWRDIPDGTVHLEPPGNGALGVRGVVSPTGGLSAGSGTVISFEEVEDEVPGSEELVLGSASDVASIVNATFGDPQLQEWIQGEKAQCPAPEAFSRVRLATRPLE